MLLPPAQAQRVMIMGGAPGGGDTIKDVDIADFSERKRMAAQLRGPQSAKAAPAPPGGLGINECPGPAADLKNAQDRNLAPCIRSNISSNQPLHSFVRQAEICRPVGWRRERSFDNRAAAA